MSSRKLRGGSPAPGGASPADRDSPSVVVASTELGRMPGLRVVRATNRCRSIADSVGPSLPSRSNLPPC